MIEQAGTDGSPARCGRTSIVAAAAHAGGFMAGELTGRERHREVVRVRHVAAWLLVWSGLSLTAAGKLLRRDHTSVLAGVRRIERDLAAGDAEVVRLIETTRRVLAGEPVPFEPDPSSAFRLRCAEPAGRRGTRVEAALPSWAMPAAPIVEQREATAVVLPPWLVHARRLRRGGATLASVAKVVGATPEAVATALGEAVRVEPEPLARMAPCPAAGSAQRSRRAPERSAA